MTTTLVWQVCSKTKKMYIMNLFSAVEREGMPYLDLLLSSHICINFTFSNYFPSSPLKKLWRSAESPEKLWGSPVS